MRHAALLALAGSVLTSSVLLASPLRETRPVPLEAKLQGGLGAVLARAAEDELVPVAIVLAEQAPAELRERANAMRDKAERRAFVKEALKEIAARSQGELLALLAEEARQGRAAERVDALWLHNAIGARVRPELALELAARADVAWISHDEPRGEEVLARAPSAGAALECGVDLMGADEVWSQLGITGSGVVVGVIDTGLCLSHPDIQAAIWKNPLEIAGNGLDDDGNGFVDDVYGWNFESNSPNVGDTNGHGSHVSGTVSGDGTAGMRSGMAPGARIMTLKFWNNFGGQMSVWQSMQYGLDNGADLLSASLGWHHSLNPDRATWRAVCDNTIAAGVVVVYAAHNFGCSSPPLNVATPGDVPDVITVGATDCNDVKAGFSSCGPVTWQNVAPYNDHPYPPGLVKPTIAAPGVGTISHDLCSGYRAMDGTSMATPHVAGAIALVLQADPTLDQFGVTAILRSTAIDLGAPGVDNETGSGRVNALAAVQAALANGNFCDAKQNSCGGLPAISFGGAPSAGATSGFFLFGSNARGGNRVGILAYTDAGQAYPPLPFDGGELCLRAPIRRGPTVLSGGTLGQCDGSYLLDMNAFAAGLAGGSPAPFLRVPGTTVTCQWWGRDTAAHGVYLTQALQYLVRP